MHIEQFRLACLTKKGAEETFPFGEDTLVYKVAGKMFALTSFSDPNFCNLKCDPDKAVELRAQYQAVEPGYHMNKQHWNTIAYNKDLPDKEILKLLQHSYELVVASLPRKTQGMLGQ